MTVSLAFYGAAGTVTGSHYVLRAGEAVLAIDCGLFQGAKALKELNYRNLPCAPGDINAVLQTHAHIDHSGSLPRLVKAGFSGPIFATPGTIDLLAWMLPDSASIQEAEVDQLNRRRRRDAVEDVRPIYDQADVRECLSRLRPVEYSEWRDVAKGVRARWWNAGHILGSASIEVAIDGEASASAPMSLLFSGDVGPKEGALQRQAAAPSGFDYLVVESTYGDRKREPIDDERRRTILEKEIGAAERRGGMIIVPAFAIERTQELIGDLTRLMAEGRLPKIPVYVDSPLASRATEVFERHLRQLDDVDHAPNPFRAPNVHYVETIEQSQALNRLTGGVIIIAGSGMCDAGRIRHHLRHHLWRPDTTVFLIGYQAPGTLGRMLEDGAPEARIFGEPIAVKASIRRLELYSGHADRIDLLDWVKARLPIKKGVFLTHGEESSLAAMKEGVAALGVPGSRVVVPDLDQVFRLDLDSPALITTALARLTGAKANEAKRGWDWHNELSALALDLRHRLGQFNDDKERMSLLKDLRRVMEKRDK
jgi:metallo-beta-lactamase family protein